MNRNLFLTILLIIVLIWMIILTVIIGNKSEGSAIEYDYSNTPKVHYETELSLNDFKHGKIVKNDFFEYEYYDVSIEIKEGKQFYYNILVDTPTVSVGELIEPSSLLGYVKTQEYCTDDYGVVINIENCDDDQKKITFTKESDLNICVTIPLDESDLLVDDFHLILVSNDGQEITIKKDYVDYLDVETDGLSVMFVPEGKKCVLFPKEEYESKRVICEYKNQMCISTQFFSSYTSFQNKLYKVFYLENSEIMEMYIRTGKKYDNYVIIENLSQDFENQIIYIEED